MCSSKELSHRDLAGWGDISLQRLTRCSGPAAMSEILPVAEPNGWKSLRLIGACAEGTKIEIRNNPCLKFARASSSELLLHVDFYWIGSARAEEVSVSYATFTASYMDHLVAFERGYFAEEGLTLNRIMVGGGTATQTLVANKLDFSSSGSSAISAAHSWRTCQGCLYQPFTTRV